MEILLQRGARDGDSQFGECVVDGLPIAHTLERVSTIIPAGRYPLRYTVSDRATRGRLWSPDAQRRLPLVDDVPGRSGIRIHAANVASELEGCTALGLGLQGDTLTLSRAAVERLIGLCLPTWDRNDPIFITYSDLEPIAEAEPT